MGAGLRERAIGHNVDGLRSTLGRHLAVIDADRDLSVVDRRVGIGAVEVQPRSSPHAQHGYQLEKVGARLDTGCCVGRRGRLFAMTGMCRHRLRERKNRKRGNEGEARE